jgi:hypothetical protein
LCMYLERNNVLIKETDIYNRILYLEYFRDKLLGKEEKEITSPTLDNLAEYIYSLNIDVESIDREMTHDWYIVLHSLLYNPGQLREKFSSKYYYKTVYTDLLFSIDPLSVKHFSPFERKENTYVRAEVQTIFEAAEKERDALIETDKFALALSPQYMSVVRQEIEDDDYLYNVLSMTKDFVFIVITNDLKLCNRLAVIADENNHTGFRKPPGMPLPQESRDLFEKIFEVYPLLRRKRPVILHDKGSELYFESTGGGTLKKIDHYTKRSVAVYQGKITFDRESGLSWPKDYLLVSKRKFWNKLPARDLISGHDIFPATARAVPNLQGSFR